MRGKIKTFNEVSHQLERDIIARTKNFMDLRKRAEERLKWKKQ